MGTGADEDLLADRIAELSSAKTEIALDQTITDRTLEMQAEAPRADDTVVDPAELPRITLGGAEGTSTSTLAEKRLPDLELVAIIGEGGMGRVHLARQRSLGRDVAVKTLKADATPVVAQALLREARVTGMLEHPGVIPVHALGVDESRRPMLVMKRVQGVDLSTRLGGNAQVGDELAWCIETLIAVCRTIEFAHSRGVVHRDIKPENIMVGGFGEVYVLDWGIATTRLGAAGAGAALVGTLVYMAPEMALGTGVDARTDVYLLGATLHEMLTGQVRHAGNTIVAVTTAAVRSEPYAYGDDVPADLASLCNRATARDPVDRPATAAAFREELSAFLRHRSARAIAEAALERVAELEALLAATAGVPADLAHAYRLAAEARFGLTQSLREDPRALAARDGMRRCIVASVELELRQDHAESAAALLRELDVPAPELQRRIDERRDVVTARGKEHARLASLARDLDPSENAKQRTLPMIAIMLGGLTVGVFVASRGALAPRSTLIASCFALVVLLGGIVATRKTLLTSTFYRRTMGLLVLAVACAVVNRTVGLFVDRPVAETLTSDLFLFAVVMFAASITLVRRLWVGAAFLVLGCGAARMWPAHASAIFPVAAFASLVTGVLILRHARSGD